MTWFAVANDLIGGWIISNRDQPLSETDTREPGLVLLADFMTEQDAKQIAELLNFQNYRESPAWNRRGTAPASD